ncbi:septation protein SepH [Nocardioides sp. SYSU D00038]|uniref:septation protein SepH n=1 Tax=Nocardioides sp. SYSU D00038 TaxID=2812554 RepID=UPI0019680E9F|nr:septation protein SepH [Nocardioides sp. SYSU D00038]
MSAHELPQQTPQGPRPERPRGSRLSLGGVSGDGRRLLLVDAHGEEFTLEIDAALRAALRGDSARLGQLEIQMDSTLRPRDIQARIRAGESPEEVARAAHSTVEKIMPFAAPVMAEREHVAQRAQRSSIRRPAGEGSGSARTLGDAIEAHLRAQNVDPETVTWDAWRREDGRWMLTGRYESERRSGTAHFVFDQPGNFVVLDDDDARWLVGDLGDGPDPLLESPVRDDLEQARARRLGVVPADELPLGTDAIELTSDAPADRAPVEPEQPVDPRATTADLTETAAAIRELGGEVPLDALLDGPPAEPTDVETEDEEPAEAPEPPARRTVRKKGGRASVPSWDEIMFGGGDQQ